MIVPVSSQHYSLPAKSIALLNSQTASATATTTSTTTA